jgi:hypothetical protein
MNYFLSDNTQVLGPFIPEEVITVINSRNLDVNKWQICDSSHIWKPLPPEIPKLAGKIISTNDPEKPNDGPGDGEEQIPGNLKFPHYQKEKYDRNAGLEEIASIRGVLDILWVKQRERIISKVKNKKIKSDHLLSAKDGEEHIEKTSKEIIQYWRKTGIIVDWIKSLTWGKNDEIKDFFFEFKETDPSNREEEAAKKIEEFDLAKPGCYCFMRQDKYVYIGMTEDCLYKRLKFGHKGKRYWSDSDSLRILIPRYAKQIKRLERLLILNYDPAENDSPGHKCSAADDVLEIIQGEVAELISD